MQIIFTNFCIPDKLKNDEHSGFDLPTYIVPHLKVKGKGHCVSHQCVRKR